MDDKTEIINLTKENEFLKKELEAQKQNYKSLSTELGKVIFQNEDLDKKNRELTNEIENLKNELKQLNKEKNELKKFKEEIESSTTWKVKSLFK